MVSPAKTGPDTDAGLASQRTEVAGLAGQHEDAGGVVRSGDVGDDVVDPASAGAVAVNHTACSNAGAPQKLVEGGLLSTRRRFGRVLLEVERDGSEHGGSGDVVVDGRRGGCRGCSWQQGGQAQHARPRTRAMDGDGSSALLGPAVGRQPGCDVCPLARRSESRAPSLPLGAQLGGIHLTEPDNAQGSSAVHATHRGSVRALHRGPEQSSLRRSRRPRQMSPRLERCHSTGGSRVSGTTVVGP